MGLVGQTKLLNILVLTFFLICLGWSFHMFFFLLCVCCSSHIVLHPCIPWKWIILKWAIIGAASSRSFDLLNSMIYDLKRSVDLRWLFNLRCYIHHKMILFMCVEQSFQISLFPESLAKNWRSRGQTWGEERKRHKFESVLLWNM